MELIFKYSEAEFTVKKLILLQEILNSNKWELFFVKAEP
jgi:hypothetical protein